MPSNVYANTKTRENSLMGLERCSVGISVGWWSLTTWVRVTRMHTKTRHSNVRICNRNAPLWRRGMPKEISRDLLPSLALVLMPNPSQTRWKTRTDIWRWSYFHKHALVCTNPQHAHAHSRHMSTARTNKHSPHWFFCWHFLNAWWILNPALGAPESTEWLVL